MTWNTTNATGETASETWADETRAAIVTDDGIITSNSTTGQTITLLTGVSAVDDYAVEYYWQEDPGPNSGHLYVVKTTINFIIKNSGATTGIKIYYRVKTNKKLS